MDMDLVILTYMDPSMLILGPMIDFGTPHPEDTRSEKTRKMERQNHKIKALERYLMLARFVKNLVKLQLFGRYRCDLTKICRFKGFKIKIVSNFS